MMKRSPRNTKRITRRDLDALRLIAAPGLQKATKLRDARKLAAFGLVDVTVTVSTQQHRATSWTASLTEAGRLLLEGDRARRDVCSTCVFR